MKSESKNEGYLISLWEIFLQKAIIRVIRSPPRGRGSQNTKIMTVKYADLLSGIQNLLVQARRQAARSVDSILVATYWEVGRRIVVFEQKGERRAGYGEQIMLRLSSDLTDRVGRGFGLSNLKQMRSFYLAYGTLGKSQTVSGLLAGPGRHRKSQTASGQLEIFDLKKVAKRFPLSWSQYVRLLSVDSVEARSFYEDEAIRGGWSVRQLNRQINSQFYERILLSKNKAAMLTKGRKSQPGDRATPEEEIKDPYILEFLNLKDEYSESDLEGALIHHLEAFLLELGEDFAFIGRQKRLRVGDEWYRIDLVFFHRKLKCMVLIDLKIGTFTHADAGQMHLYLNYAREHWMRRGENPPVGLILCAKKNESVAHYALEGLPNKVLASEYKTTLPNEKELAKELQRTKKALDVRLAQVVHKKTKS